jgi:type IV secretory pathway TraG/TraD family ATPase VirD4
MAGIEIFAPLIAVYLVNLTLAQVSKPLAEVVTLAIIAGPVVWSLGQLWKAGKGALHPSNWGFSLGHVLILAPAVAAIYCFNTNHQLWGVVAMLAYGVFAKEAWGRMFDQLHFFGRGGAGAGDETVRRGSRVVEAHELDALTSSKKARDDADVSIGGVTIPRMLEAQHFLISGTTGAGKTQVINGMLRSIRKRGNRAVIADPAGGFYARFGQAGDMLLNPFDKRSIAWSPFAEIKADYDCERIARAIIPDLVGGGDGSQWQLFAQTLLAKAMLSMHRGGERSIKRLLYWMTSADQKELEPLLAGTPAAVLTQKGNDKMLNNTRATMVPYLAVFDYLPDEGTFSIRDWIREDWRDNWLFITYRDDQMGLLRNLVATALEMALVEGLSLSENQERGLWYVMDEVDSLGKVSSLRAGLTKLRKYGGRCVLGLQTISQLRTTYGRDEAQTLIANTSVKCILRAGDAETAKSMEHELGEQEIERNQLNESFSTNDHGTSQSESMSTQVVRQSTVLASEVMGLPDLNGFLKLPGDEIARIAVDYVSMPDVNPAFEG